MLTYIDQRFLLDVDFLAKVSETFTEIISNIRYYPYPTIVYKIAINKHINEMEGGEGRVQSAEASVIPTPDVATTTKKPKNPDSEKKESDPIHTQTTDNDQLLQDILDRLDPGSFRDNLHDQIVIDEVTDTKMKIIAINKISEMTLKKPENITKIQKILSELLGRDVSIEVKFENKENYFARKLG